MYVKPQRPQNFGVNLAYYRGDTDKRLYVYARNPAGVIVRLIRSGVAGVTRPVVCLTINARNILAVHLPSVSSTSTPQAAELRGAYNQATALGFQPDAFFGDFNVDRLAPARTTSLTNNLAGHALAGWHVVNTGAPTHKGNSELDWAFCAPGFNPNIESRASERPEKAKLQEIYSG